MTTETSNRITAAEAAALLPEQEDTSAKDLEYVYSWVRHHSYQRSFMHLSAGCVSHPKVQQQLIDDGYTLKFDVNGFGEKIVTVSWGQQ
jgi:hypothetical protein